MTFSLSLWSVCDLPVTERRRFLVDAQRHNLPWNWLFSAVERGITPRYWAKSAVCVKQSTRIGVQVCWVIGGEERWLYNHPKRMYALAEMRFWDEYCKNRRSVAHFSRLDDKTVNITLLIAIYSFSSRANSQRGLRALALPVTVESYKSFHTEVHRLFLSPRPLLALFSVKDGNPPCFFLNFVLRNKQTEGNQIELVQCRFLSWECQTKG